MPPVIQDDDPWNSKPANDVFLDEALDFCLCDLGKGSSMTYLVKYLILTSKNQVFFLPCRSDPTMSIPHVANGHDKAMHIIFFVGIL